MNLKRLLWLIIPVIILILWLNRELISYGWMQGKGQLEVISRAHSIDEVLQENKLPDSLNAKLLLLNSIKDFADSIGLEVNDSYSTIYDQQGKPILWNVSACKPFAFESFKWRFPFLGTFSYKGFFDKTKADELVVELQNQGYDVNIRTVGAWSTLGWFNDPLLSNQLNRPIGSLAETVFHELTHATVFFKDSLTFNENLATFIGEQAADLFLIQQFGPEASERKQYQQREKDSRLYRAQMLVGKERLDSLYQTFEDFQSMDQKLALKNEVLKEIIKSLDTVAFSDTRYKSIFTRGRELNNAYLMGFNRYYDQQGELDSMLAVHDGNLKAWIESLKEVSN